MTPTELKEEVLKALRGQQEVFTTMLEVAGEPTKLCLTQVLETVADTIEDMEELDDGPPAQDESALAHNELDRLDVPRQSTNPDGSPAEQATDLPLWFRVRRLAERHNPADQSEGPTLTLALPPEASATLELTLFRFDASLYCATCRANGRLSSLEEQSGSIICLRCETET